MRQLKKNSGIALVLVLWVIMLLSVIAGEFCHVMRTEAQITKNFMEQTQAYYIAHAGISMAMSGLIQQMVDMTNPRQNVSESSSKVKWRIHAPIPPISFAQGYVEIKIENESGKVNLNEADQNLLHVVLKAFNIDENQRNIIVDSIIDWRDADNFHQLNGAEDDYYQSLSKPYSCKNANFDTIEELLLVRGMTPELFYSGLNEMVTAFSQSPNLLTPGFPMAAIFRKQSNRININAASPKLLRALPQMTDDLVAAMIQYREKKDFLSVHELVSVIGPEVYKAIYPYISLDISPFYTITATGRIENSQTKHTVQALVEINFQLPDKYRIIQWRDVV